MTKIIDDIVDIVLCAAEVIVDIYETKFDVNFKSDKSPVTKADLAAEAIIQKKLAQAAVNIPVIAEEASITGTLPKIGREFFLVDPLDGTKEFIKKNDEFTVNIALIRDNLPILGVVFSPAKGWLFAGETGKGAWRADVVNPRLSHKIENRQKISAHRMQNIVDVINSRSHHTSSTRAYLKNFKIGKEKSIGSSLKFCLLASGEADIYPRFGTTMEWDTAAGDAILRAAGGKTLQVNGDALVYGKQDQIGRTDFSNPHFITFGQPNPRIMCDEC